MRETSVAIKRVLRIYQVICIVPEFKNQTQAFCSLREEATL